MKTRLSAALLVPALLALSPAPAAADLTAFWGVSPTPTSRKASGISIGMGLLLVGVEFEYGKIVEDEVEGAPSLTTGMGNVLLMTPSTGIQLYATTGGGFYRERWRDFTTTHFGTNVGGGAKIGLTGPLRLRIDYRVFRLNGRPIEKTYQRVYAGLNVAF